MRWTRTVPKTSGARGGRRSRVVLTPRRWRQVLEKQASWGRRWQESPVTGKSAKETVKTIRAGNAGCFRCDRGDYARVLFHFAREAAGASCTRHSLRPLSSEDGTIPAKLARTRGEIAKAWLEAKSQVGRPRERWDDTQMSPCTKRHGRPSFRALPRRLRLHLRAIDFQHNRHTSDRSKGAQTRLYHRQFRSHVILSRMAPTRRC